MWNKFYWIENGIGEDGAHILFDSLENNSTLTELDLYESFPGKKCEYIKHINNNFNKIINVKNRCFKDFWYSIDCAESKLYIYNQYKENKWEKRK